MSKTRKETKKRGRPKKQLINSIMSAALRNRKFNAVYELNKCVMMFENDSGELRVAFSDWPTVERFISTNRAFHKMTFYQNLYDMNLEGQIDLQRRLVKKFGLKNGNALFKKIIDKALELKGSD